MTYVGNGPEDRVVLRLEARKSFALGLWIQDYNGRPLDILGATLRIVVRKRVGSDVVDDSANLIVNSMAQIITPSMGFARFEFQASDLDHPAGEYFYSIVMVYEGYSAVIVKGPLELEQNTEFSSVDETYTTEGSMSSALTVILRNQIVLNVRTGPTLAPGEATFTHEDEQKLDELYAGALAEGQVLNADLIPDGTEKVMMTLAEREALENIEAGTTDWGDVEGKPNFGTASLEDVETFVQTGAGDASDIATGVLNNGRIPLVTELRGIVITTDDPPGGNPGVLYLKYTP